MNKAFAKALLFQRVHEKVGFINAKIAKSPGMIVENYLKFYKTEK